ncbi:MAG TPA: alcohol dehydrogenase catalytic domain-containing protein [Acidimicrobiia bacterium]|nr:alcohol dehydrogenase catalytic domain-containing protein [Acidimicrobiia bacterium]
MKAAVYYGPGDVRLMEMPDPVAGEGELLLDVATVGICGSDVGEFVHDPHFFPVGQKHPFSGHVGPTIPGHEFSGTVAMVGPGVEGYALGDLVASGAGVACGHCSACRRGATNLCETYWTVGLHAHGAMAARVAVPASCCMNLATTSLSPDLAALAQPMSIAVHASRRGRLVAGDVVVVLGVGGIGSFITFASAAAGATVVAVDINPSRLEVATALGASTTIDASNPLELSDRIFTAAGPPTLAFECTAIAESLQLAVRTVTDNGRVVIVGHQPQPVRFDFKQVSFGEKELIGTMAHAFAEDFGVALELIERNPEVWTRVAPTVHPLDSLLTAGLIPMVEGRQNQIKTLFDPSLNEPRPLRTHR